MAEVLRRQRTQDSACWIGPDTVHAIPEASDTAAHTENVCSPSRPSLPEHFG